MQIVDLIKRKLFKGDFKETSVKSIHALLIRLSGIIFSFLFATLVTRHFGVDAWGVFSITFAFQQIAGKISRLGIEKNFARTITELHFHQHKLFHAFRQYISITIKASSIVSILLFASAPFLSQMFLDGKSVYLFQITAISILPYNLLFFAGWAFKGLKNALLFSLFDAPILFISSSIFIAFLLFFPISNADFIYAYYSSTVVVGILVIVYTRRKIQLIDQLTLTKDNNSQPELYALSTRQIIQQSLPFLLAGTFFLLLQWVDTLMLSYISGQYETGLYNISTRITRFVTLFYTSFDSIMLPKITELFIQNKWKELQQYLQKTNKLIFFLSMPLILIIFMFNELILNLFNSQLTSSNYAFYVMCGLLLNKVIHVLFGNVATVLQACNLQIKLQNINIISLILNILINLWLIPQYGALGAGIASAISILIFNILCFWNIKKHLGINALFWLR